MPRVVVPAGRQELFRFAPVAAKGSVYTRPWVVELILDLVGYTSERDLASMKAVEPAAGDGAFLLPMLRRLLASISIHHKSLGDAGEAIVAYELHPAAADAARAAVIATLREHNVPRGEAARFASRAVVCRDYLLDAERLGVDADLVVGNPPYVRYDDIERGLLSAYKHHHPTMIGRGDLYVGFIEAAVNDLKPSGRLGFICADRWMRSAYGSALREFVSARCSVDYVIDMQRASAFEDDVSAYPAIIILTRGEQGPTVVGTADESAAPPEDGSQLRHLIDGLAREPSRTGSAGFRAVRVNKWHEGPDPWPWAEPHALRLLRKLEGANAPLESRTTETRVGIGVATGADAAFITCDADIVEASRLLPLAMSKDTKSGALDWSGHSLVNPWDEDGKLVDLGDYPKLRAYFESAEPLLRRRNIAKRQPANWYRTIDKVIPGLLEREKLYLPDMKLEAHPVLDRGQTYPHHNLYFVVSKQWDLEVLGGLLLSKVAELFISSYCVKMRGGTLRFQAQYLRRIRVPDPDRISGNVRDRLREAFRGRDRDEATIAACLAYGIETSELHS